ncbi:hypothetical protein AMD27_15115 [Acinetobacter sp. TGL-Y2]|nr:hypothetical protein AMD27_15115 [Acinetobacter sp. TGL-Y2]
MKKEKRTESNKIRFLIVSDFKILLAIDTKTQDTVDVPFNDLAKKFNFFYLGLVLKKQFTKVKTLLTLKLLKN